MQTRLSYILRFFLASTDLVILNLCFYLAFYITNKYGQPVDSNFYRNNVTVCNLIWIVSTGIFSLYGEKTILKMEFVFRATWKSVGLQGLIFLAFLFLSHQAGFPKGFLIAFYVLLIFSFLLSRFMGTTVQTLFLKKYDMRKAVAILSLNKGSIKLASYLETQSSLNFVGFLHDPSFHLANDESTEPSMPEMIKAAANAGIQEVYVSVNREHLNDLSELIKEGEKHCVRLKFVPDLSALQANFKIDQMGKFTVLCARKEPLENIENLFKKRLFDVIVSSAVIVFVFSWLYPVLAIIIKFQSRGPVLFKQIRTGRDNKPFACYKFRSMRMNNSSDVRQASENDDRITPIGRFMRKTSLDEFPQFFNVLMGYMSIIGPRPHMLSHTEQYRKIIDKYMVRQFSKPGISGWAQVNGYRGETKENILMEKRVQHDIHYLENWSLMLDVKILFLTVIRIFKGDEKAF